MMVLQFIKVFLASLLIFGLIGALYIKLTYLSDKNINTYEFPEHFKIGAASACYQIEGGWNLDGKSPSIWDTLVHNHPELISDGTNGDIGADSYHFYKEDVQAIKNAGMSVYRFSISWSRILPDDDTVNPAGIQYYNNLIDELISNGIEPLVTIFHWDLPQFIQDLGGFLDPIIVEYFSKFAEVLFESFGDRVKRWITFNEPYIFCVHGHSEGSKAPLIKAPGTGEYLCGHYLLRAHAAAARIYNEKFRGTQNGQVGISLFTNFYYPKTSADKDLADQVLQFQLGWFAHPIFSKEGGYPSIMVKEIAKKSSGESRLPVMSELMKSSLIGSADFLAFNYYTSRIVTPLVKTSPVDDWYSDMGADWIVDEKWNQGKSEWLYVVPEGLHELLKWIKKEYNNPTVMITENGYPDGGDLNDDDRIDYIKGHLAAISNAINEDKCDVVAYTVWSIIDNFEWTDGYTEKFGIYAVNLTSPTKERIAKKFVKFFQTLSKDKKFDYSTEIAYSFGF